ncbi:hypothetical protein BB934_39385 (plasmid) [Microvirga ossetica]|uniref:RNA polymerase sigma factor 70 region 1.1 domain-containing protein n=1 Tax=Microvirga ossetica TaxID=1882682 RepID=A0A1B2EWF7_9HYPH|nr:RNA polymerase sigma factor region1.1 domain-containing protein [Microvirga ossetica]ANY84287.1 hypothetical protein BB934_39385 [Microvirga ossetica]
MGGWKPIATAPREPGRPLLLYPRPQLPEGRKARVFDRNQDAGAFNWGQDDRPRLDLTDVAVRQMIRLAKKRGSITYDELDRILPPDEFSPEQIEDVLNQLAEMGIDLVEDDEPEESQPVPSMDRGRAEDAQAGPPAIYASIFEGHWDGSRWRTSTGLPCEPTHWMPMPSPPLTLVHQ